ncbi:MAG: TIGR04255 family protein [Putridiphycobacter sp.]
MGKLILKNNPVREALLAIYFKEEINNIDSLEKISDKFFEDFSSRNKSQIISAQLKPNETTTSEFKTDGFIQTNNELRKTIQIKKDRIVVNKLNPYNNWEELLETLKKIFKEYLSVFQSLKINSIQVRYINDLILEDLNKVDIKKQINLIPVLNTERSASEINNFIIKLATKKEDLNGIIIEATEYDEVSDRTKILLDITVNKYFEDVLDIKDIWSCFKRVRKYKNELFQDIVGCVLIEKYK